ncbi:MAG: phosphoenolpyruvate--protein phosphotransferase [Spirochaetes bacterium]|nr:phosphoenolpyruvate--protein phosphotransferase [Spirochaetota bacterium]
MSKSIEGIIASPGIVIGKAYIYRGDNIIVPKYTIPEDQVEKEIRRYDESLAKTKEEIKAIQSQIASSLSNDMADIFKSHLMVLEDPYLDQKVRETISKEKRNAEWVLNDISLQLIQSLKSIEDEYLRERIIDISDINKRLINNLQKTHDESLADLKEEVIVVATDLTPSDTAMMNKKYVLGFITDRGGRTSHTAIMARALEIPAIVGSQVATSLIKHGDIIILDAIHGKIIVNPSKDEISEYEKYREDLKQLENELASIIELPSHTLDNETIYIYGNIEIPDEMNIIRDHGAQGIGLFRSEFLFLDKSLPDEEKQFEEYKKVVEFFNPHPVTIRTLDIGGDKIYAFTKQYKERNPFLGCRAIRFSLENEFLFRPQLRAILRASAYGNVKLMFPMISSVEELLKAKSILYDEMENLQKLGIPFNQNLPVGIMIEVPSTAINVDIFCKYCDFFSVGTNDLVQYTLAVDRISEKIAYLYNPLNLAVLRLLKLIADVSSQNNIPLSICGEMAGEPKYTMLLIGLGYRQLSMSSAFMYQIKRIIRSVTVEECKEMVNNLMQLDSTYEIENAMMEVLNKKFPNMFFK